MGSRKWEVGRAGTQTIAAHASGCSDGRWYAFELQYYQQGPTPSYRQESFKLSWEPALPPSAPPVPLFRPWPSWPEASTSSAVSRMVPLQV